MPRHLYNIHLIPQHSRLACPKNEKYITYIHTYIHTIHTIHLHTLMLDLTDFPLRPYLSFISSHRSRPSNWSLPPSPPQPAPALPSSCSSSATLLSWSDWGRNWEPGVFFTMGACALKENSGWTLLGASSTLTASSRRCWDSSHQSQGPTELPCRPLNLT